MQKIYTKITGRFVGNEIVLDTEEYICYDGLVDKCCGASAAQNAAQTAQASAYTQMTQQATQVFGSDSSVFQNLQQTFQPTIAAGPSQQGFSAAEQSSLNSQAITNGGIAARNAKQATGEAVAAQGGGNNAALQSGVDTGIEAQVNESAAENTANQLGTIQNANYAQGNQNYNNAVAGLAGSTNAFNSANAAGSAATGAGVASANTANQIATQNNSWMQAVSGALGGVGAAALGVATGGGSTALQGGLQAAQQVASDAGGVDVSGSSGLTGLIGEE